MAAEILDIVTNGDVWIVTLNVNPVTNGGVAAPIGSYGSAIDGSGLFLKTGVADTDWIKADSNLISGEVDLDFGFPVSNEGDVAKVTVPNLLVTNENLKSFSFVRKTSSDHDLDDFMAENINVAIQNIQDNVSFDIVATAPNNTWGIFKIKYVITI